MGPFGTMANKLRTLKAALPAIALAALESNRDLIIELNTKDQLYKQGVKRTGDAITPSYAPSTIKRKKRKGLPFDRVTLFDTGKFHSSFKVEFNRSNNTFELDSEDEKKKYLIARYSSDIFGLSDESLEILRDKLKAEIETSINNYLND